MSTNVGSVVKFFPSAQNGFTTTLASTISSGAAIVPLNSVAGYSNGEVAVMIIEPTSSTAKQTLTGTVDTAGVRLTGVVWTAGTNQSHLAGVTVVDYETATHFSMISRGILQQHNQDGSHNNITSTQITNVGALTQTGTTTLNGSWDGWVGANEAWTYASASTITVPTDATTKYNYGDYVKITQSATVKYFVVIGVTATVLTVSGIYGATVANSAITANAYSKARNPQGVAGMLPLNPYKFSAYRNAAWTSSAGTVAKVPFDSELYDSGSNFDSTTNRRFVAPINGFYAFKAAVTVTVGAGDVYSVYLYKNGSLVKQGASFVIYFAFNTTFVVSGDLQLNATDYVEVYFQNGSGSDHAGGAGAALTYFDGFLVSAA